MRQHHHNEVLRQLKERGVAHLVSSGHAKREAYAGAILALRQALVYMDFVEELQIHVRQSGIQYPLPPETKPVYFASVCFRRLH